MDRPMLIRSPLPRLSHTGDVEGSQLRATHGASGADQQHSPVTGVDERGPQMPDQGGDNLSDRRLL